MSLVVEKKSCNQKKLIPGTIVHFVELRGDKCKAGVINRVENVEGQIGLHIFYPGATCYEERSVNYSFLTTVGRSWHYMDECTCRHV